MSSIERSIEMEIDNCKFRARHLVCFRVKSGDGLSVSYGNEDKLMNSSSSLVKRLDDCSMLRLLGKISGIMA